MVRLVGVVWFYLKLESNPNSNQFNQFIQIQYCWHMSPQQDPILLFSQMFLPKSSHVGSWHLSPPTGNPGSTTVVIDGFWMDLATNGMYLLKSRISIYMNPCGFYRNPRFYHEIDEICVNLPLIYVDFTMKLINLCEFILNPCGFYAGIMDFIMKLKNPCGFVMNQYGFFRNLCGFYIEIQDFTMKLMNLCGFKTEILDFTMNLNPCEFVIIPCGF